MFIGHFTERPYQDPNSGYFGATGLSIKDLTLSNETYDPQLGAHLAARSILVITWSGTGSGLELLTVIRVLMHSYTSIVTPRLDWTCSAILVQST